MMMFIWCHRASPTANTYRIQPALTKMFISEQGFTEQLSSSDNSVDDRAGDNEQNNDNNEESDENSNEIENNENGQNNTNS